VIPEGLARRAILVSDPAAPVVGTNAIGLAIHPSERGRLFVEVIASAVVSDDPAALARSEALIEECGEAPAALLRGAGQPDSRSPPTHLG
jgi:hypothetical protein